MFTVNNDFLTWDKLISTYGGGGSNHDGKIDATWSSSKIGENRFIPKSLLHEYFTVPHYSTLDIPSNELSDFCCESDLTVRFKVIGSNFNTIISNNMKISYLTGYTGNNGMHSITNFDIVNDSPAINEVTLMNSNLVLNNISFIMATSNIGSFQIHYLDVYIDDTLQSSNVLSEQTYSGNYKKLSYDGSILINLNKKNSAGNINVYIKYRMQSFGSIT